MVTGVLTERAVCEPLKHPEQNRMFQLVDKFVEVKSKLYPKNPQANINLKHIIE